MTNGKKNDHYQEYLASLHNKLVTPDPILQEIIKTGTGKKMAGKTRIVAGEVNEVYDIELENGQHVILRISKSEQPGFLQEQWAIEKMQKIGVPVPGIILIEQFKDGEETKSACLMEKVEGEPLERGSIEFDKLDLSLKRRLINQAGEILAKIHSVETEGFGWIAGEGQAEHKTSDELINTLLDQQEQLEKIASEENIDKIFIQKALDIIESFKPIYSQIKPHLNHGDWSHKHFMVKNDQIVAILDWGGVRSDSPIYDFAWWDYWFGEEIPTEWLKEGYANKSLFDDKFEDLLHMLKLFRGLEMIAWYHHEKYKPAVEKAKVKLINDLNYFHLSAL